MAAIATQVPPTSCPARPPLAYRIIRVLANLFAGAAYRRHIIGLERVPERGGMIVVFNHLHLLDAFAFAPPIRRQVIALVAARWARNPFTNVFFRAVGAVYVRRGEVDRQALKACLDIVKKEGLLAVAPEGTRSRVGSLQQAKLGIAYMAAKSDAILVPVGLWGVEDIKHWRPWRRPDLHVVYGEPFRLPSQQGRLTTEKLEEMTEIVMVRIARLLPEEYRGVYAELASEAAAPCAEGPDAASA